MPVSLSQFFFGNSLVNFAGGSQTTNVPYWVDQFADHAGHGYAVNGGYGFLREFADGYEQTGAPDSGWGFSGVDSAWNSDGQGFAEVDFDMVVITPANFL